MVLEVDATIVAAHSEKENTAATFKRAFGYHPIGVWCDNTEELLAAKLRAGNAGSNTTTDHIEVLSEAIAQGSRHPPPQVADPFRWRRGVPRGLGLVTEQGKGPRPQLGVLGPASPSARRSAMRSTWPR